MTRLSVRSLVLALALLASAPAAAQQPVLRGGDDSHAVRRARGVLERGRYVWIDRDTVLGPEFRTGGDLVVYDAEVRLEGNVEGSVAVLGGDLWVRPGGRVGGAVAVVGGGFYPSGLAIVEADSVFETRTATAVAVRTVPDSGGIGRYTAEIRVTPPPRPPLVSPTVARFPTYDRVNGLTLAASAVLRPTRRERGPEVDVWAAYRFEQENELGGGATFRLPLLPQGVALTGEASRATRSNDAWIRGDVSNSVRAAVLGRDYRDYYDADVFRLMLERVQDRALIAGESWLGPRAGVQVSYDRSLPARDPWSLFGDGLSRENPDVVEGTVASALVGAAYRWRGLTTTFDADGVVEHAPEGVGDVSFTQARLEGTYFTTALRTHTLRLYFRGTAPLGGDAPPQRFGILGGGGTLPTEPLASFRGDRLAYVEGSYLVPYERFTLPYLGIPSVELRHAVGAAWVGDSSPEWVQNSGIGIVFPFAFVRLLGNPADRPLEPKLSVGLSIPQF